MEGKGMGHPSSFAVAGFTTLFLMVTLGMTRASLADDQKTVAELDTQYQAAVKRNDPEAMGRILLDNFVLVVGNGTTYTKADLLKEAQTRETAWEQQDEEPGTQVVRVWGDTAVVTAKLWLKGQTGGKTFDRKLWFSDTYVRTPTGWRYAFGQASLSLPAAP
jgi:ketosteroid isomerase-like protein